MTFSLTVLGFIFIIGLVIGSFLNVVILRTVSGESIVFPSSKCPKCGTPLKWYHNIPVLSYIFLRGKCGFCKEHISLQYPIVELLTGILFVLLFIKFCNPFDPLFGLSAMNAISWYQAVVFLISILATCLFIAIAGTDIIEKKVSDAHTYSLIGLGIVSALLYSIATLITFIKTVGMPAFDLKFFLYCPVTLSIMNAVLGFVIVELVSRIGQYTIGARTFGEGDSYIAAGMGALFGMLTATSPIYNGAMLPGIYTLFSILILSVIIQVFITLPIYIKKLIKEKSIVTLGSIAGFTLFATGYFFARYAGWLDNKWAYITSTLVLAAIGLFACREVITGMKKGNKIEGLYLPFGPAMIIAGLIALFFFPI